MTARIEEIHRYQAYCLGCAWWGDEVDFFHTAEFDADVHNDECHTEGTS